MSESSRWIPTALGSERSVQPAAFAAFRTAGPIDGAGPSPKPTLEPRMNLLGSIALIESESCAAVVAAAAASAAGAAVVPAPDDEELELLLPEPQPASTSNPASSASARRAVTPRTLERLRHGPYSSSCR